MRCGCPECEAYMIHSESGYTACVCPHCAYRCNACLGTNTVLSREELLRAREEMERAVMKTQEKDCGNEP